MSESTGNTKPRPWLIAAWPGMGNVAILAAGHLIEQLEMVQVHEFAPDDYFEMIEVEVKDGLVQPIRLPQGLFFKWSNPGAGRDLLIFIGSAQPSSRSLAYARELLNAGVRMGIERVVTFASLASGLHPSENPKVSGVATDAATLADLRRAEVEPTADGQIGGLNGLILGVAAERHIPGMCLLAEIPFFAMRVPNPKAARAALSVFSVLAGIDINLESLNRHAAIVDRALLDAMEKMDQQRAAEGEGPREPSEDEAASQQEPESGTKQTRASKLEPAERARIEELFEAVRRDPSQAVHLKKELDRLGVFKEYEGRFLDLFRRAG